VLDAAPFSAFLHSLHGKLERLKGLMLRGDGGASLRSSRSPMGDPDELSNRLGDIRLLFDGIADRFHRYSERMLRIDQTRRHLFEIVHKYDCSATRLDQEFINEWNRNLPWLPQLDCTDGMAFKPYVPASILAPELKLCLLEFDFSIFTDLDIWIRSLVSLSTISPSIAPHIVSICEKYQSIMDRSLSLVELKRQVEALVDKCEWPAIPESGDRDLLMIIEWQCDSFESLKARLKCSLGAGIAKMSVFESELSADLERWSNEADELGNGF
jgi:hypothetical protein